MKDNTIMGKSASLAGDTATRGDVRRHAQRTRAGQYFIKALPNATSHSCPPLQPRPVPLSSENQWGPVAASPRRRRTSPKLHKKIINFHAKPLSLNIHFGCQVWANDHGQSINRSRVHDQLAVHVLQLVAN